MDNQAAIVPAGNIPQVPYSKVRPTLKSGDALIFVGRSTSPIDWMIQTVEGAPYTHVGLVITDNNNPYLWDAPGGGTQYPDPFFNNKPHPGARAAPLDDVLAFYMNPTNGELAMYLRRVQPAVSPDQYAAWRCFISVAIGLPFPGESIKWPDQMGLGFGMAASLLAGETLHVTMAGSFYCAHLAAESYMRMGLLPIAPFPANSYEPANFGLATPAKLPLVPGVSMSDIVQVMWGQ